MLKERRDIREEIRATIHGKMELVCLDLVKYELERLVRQGSSATSRTARLALDNFDKWKIRIAEAPYGPREVDLVLAIYALAEKSRVIVATADRKLLDTLSKNKIPTVRPSNQSGLIASWKD